jgi:hypothetical protein
MCPQQEIVSTIKHILFFSIYWASCSILLVLKLLKMFP